MEPWKKQQVERIPARYAEEFPEDIGDCFLCEKQKGMLMSMQPIAADDPRIPEWMEGMNILFTFSLCDECHDLPDVEERVNSKIAAQECVV
jgi:hypothetical protein